MENDPFIDGLPIKMVIFYSYVKLPEGKPHVLMSLISSQQSTRFFPEALKSPTDFIPSLHYY
jgi:hypothetical protein